jgi:transcriptional regulator with XRE-family HTH domain
METSSIGERLRRLRNHVVGLTVRELSALAGLKAPTHVGLLEAGKRPNPSAETLVALAQVLGTTVEWIVTGEGNEPSADEVHAAVNRARGLANTASSTG